MASGFTGIVDSNDGLVNCNCLCVIMFNFIPSHIPDIDSSVHTSFIIYFPSQKLRTIWDDLVYVIFLKHPLPSLF